MQNSVETANLISDPIIIPDAGGIQSHLAFNFYSSGLWNDEYKNGKKHFVCQYKGIWYLNILIGESIKNK